MLDKTDTRQTGQYAIFSLASSQNLCQTMNKADYSETVVGEDDFSIKIGL